MLAGRPSRFATCDCLPLLPGPFRRSCGVERAASPRLRGTGRHARATCPPSAIRPPGAVQDPWLAELDETKKGPAKVKKPSSMRVATETAPAPKEEYMHYEIIMQLLKPGESINKALRRLKPPKEPAIPKWKQERMQKAAERSAKAEGKGEGDAASEAAGPADGTASSSSSSAAAAAPGPAEGAGRSNTFHFNKLLEVCRVRTGPAVDAAGDGVTFL